MIDLNIQIASFLFSFVLGFVISFMIRINYKITLKSNKFIKAISTIFIVIINTFIYFIGIRYINNAYIHPYFIMMIILGWIFEEFLSKRISNMFEKAKLK